MIIDCTECCCIVTPWTISTISSDSIREKMKKNYLSNPSYNYDQVNRASLACGPMVKWAIAQVEKPEQYENKDYNWVMRVSV